MRKDKIKYLIKLIMNYKQLSVIASDKITNDPLFRANLKICFRNFNLNLKIDSN